MKIVLILVLILSGCLAEANPKLIATQEKIVGRQDNSPAEVIKVAVTGEENSYTFAVTIESPDTGCDRYADWWEVITPEGELIYRRVLLHSHVDEQPFQRSGGVVAVKPQEEVIVRAHMSPDGYSFLARQGTVKSGFAAVELPAGFAANLESVKPLPQNCAF